MGKAEALARQWRLRLERDYPDPTSKTHAGILCWLFGETLDRWDDLDEDRSQIAEQSMEFRYSILRARYLGVAPEAAYRHLVRRLGSLVLLRNKIRTWVALSRDRRRTVVDVVQEVIQEMLDSDRYLQREMERIAECTTDARLRNALVLSSLEEYCLRPIRNQPLLVYRFVNYLRRAQRGGLTQVPTQELVRLVSAEVAPSDREDTVNLIDTQTLAQSQSDREWEDQQTLRGQVAREFTDYLEQNVSSMAAQWLTLYLQGYSQDEIAKRLNVPVPELYRLREKIGYHAIRVFALKQSPDLVASWLKISLQEHSLGLTPHQWQQYLERLTPQQRQMLDRLKAGQSIETIAQELNLKTNQVMGEWSKLYLTAQQLRNSTD
ncbi:MAG: HetZ-related protein 2 [Cyanobacteria bacterium SID2]|nr:HetZ-related protein 2 [Cyanobacteria bacterium SID2]MBP0005517.1 HetZ-related protein 2 [Cyanobacteria bacterium SBC]